MDRLNPQIGTRIRSARRGAAFSIDAFCARIGVSPFRLAQIEKGRVQARADELYRMKTILRLDLKTFYEHLKLELGEPDA